MVGVALKDLVKPSKINGLQATSKVVYPKKPKLRLWPVSCFRRYWGFSRARRGRENMPSGKRSRRLKKPVDHAKDKVRIVFNSPHFF